MGETDTYRCPGRPLPTEKGVVLEGVAAHGLVAVGKVGDGAFDLIDAIDKVLKVAVPEIIKARVKQTQEIMIVVQFVDANLLLISLS